MKGAQYVLEVGGLNLELLQGIWNKNVKLCEKCSYDTQ